MRYCDIVEAVSSVPVKTFNKLFHVGTLDVAHKEAGSYEGAGLSVSLHPEAWIQIAKLSGSIWQCTKPGNQFLNFYKLSKMNKKVIDEWAIQQGLAVPKTVWRVPYYDEEEDQTRYFTFYDEDKAKVEAEAFGTKPKRINWQMVSTPRLAHRMLQHVSGVECRDLIVAAYAEDVMRYDGVWWSERLNPEMLSAPRGVIVPSMVPSWTFTKSMLT